MWGERLEKTESQRKYHVMTETETGPTTAVSQKCQEMKTTNHQKLGRSKESFYPEFQGKCGY